MTIDGFDDYVILVGAEGCSETDDEDWIRDATKDEIQSFKEAVQAKATKQIDFGSFTVDGNGRPYWYKVVLKTPTTPSLVLEKAQKYTRVVRLTD
jgi:hypothetical protein